MPRVQEMQTVRNDGRRSRRSRTRLRSRRHPDPHRQGEGGNVTDVRVIITRWLPKDEVRTFRPVGRPPEVHAGSVEAVEKLMAEMNRYRVIETSPPCLLTPDGKVVDL